MVSYPSDHGRTTPYKPTQAGTYYRFYYPILHHTISTSV